MSEQSLVNYHLIELKIAENLSERATNICLDNELDSLFKVLDYFIEHQSFIELRNCGKKTNEELVTMCHKYIDKYDITHETLKESDHHRTFEEYKLFCFEQFNLSTHEAETFRHAFLEERFPLFQFMLTIVKKLLSEREYFIFEHNFGYFENKNKLTLQAIGNLYNITRERIRQISHDIPFKVRDVLSPFAEELFFIENHIQYDLKKYKDYILIDEKTKESINSSEDLNCTARFYSFGFSMLYHNEYYFFQEQYDDYKQYYLINRKLAEQFDFAEFYHNLSTKAGERITTDIVIDFRHYVRSFYRPGKFSYFERIVDMCRHIASGEFGFRCNLKDELLIPRNTKVKLSEFILQILKEKNRPMHLKEIADELIRRKLKTSSGVESLRSSILTLDEVVAIGKTSTYALASWSNIKTGTIKELAKEFLEDREHPVRISELAKHINLFRKTQEKNVYSNLKLDKSGTFVFYKGGYVGLGSKNYTSLGSTIGQLSLL